MVFREKEYDLWIKHQKGLLEREHSEKGILKACKKRLKEIQKSIYKNNEFLRRR
jgi:hypothetical protein